jgi:glycerophosphoryl diester phosphodiesterase
MSGYLTTTPLIIAHRGASMDAPENTAIAFELAAQQGATMIETDLHLTADEQIVIIHDATVNKTTDGRGRVLNMTLPELKALDAGGWFGNEFAGQTILTLEELIDLLEHYHLNANLEIKSEPTMEKKTSEKIAELLQKYWPSNKEPPLISSFSVTALARIQQLAPHLPRGLLLEKWDNKASDRVQELECLTVNLAQRGINESTIAAVKALNKKLLVYTINQASYARQLFNLGIDGIFTDCPGYLINALKD